VRCARICCVSSGAALRRLRARSVGLTANGLSESNSENREAVEPRLSPARRTIQPRRVCAAVGQIHASLPHRQNTRIDTVSHPVYGRGEGKANARWVRSRPLAGKPRPPPPSGARLVVSVSRQPTKHSTFNSSETGSLRRSSRSRELRPLGDRIELAASQSTSGHPDDRVHELSCQRSTAFSSAHEARYRRRTEVVTTNNYSSGD
jgi:hypothetical protein